MCFILARSFRFDFFQRRTVIFSSPSFDESIILQKNNDFFSLKLNVNTLIDLEPI